MKPEKLDAEWVGVLSQWTILLWCTDRLPTVIVQSRFEEPIYRFDNKPISPILKMMNHGGGEYHYYESLTGCFASFECLKQREDKESAVS